MSVVPRPLYYVIPVSANPLHAGHLNMFHHIPGENGDVKSFEISKTHVEKAGMMPFGDRFRQFTAAGLPIFTTENCSTFLAKAKHIRGESTGVWKYDIVFAVGVDCFQRIYDPKYYFDSEDEMHRAISELKYDYFCSFLVFERNGVKLSDLTDVPMELLEISEEAQDYTSIDISSTEIRDKERCGNEPPKNPTKVGSTPVSPTNRMMDNPRDDSLTLAERFRKYISK